MKYEFKIGSRCNKQSAENIRVAHKKRKVVKQQQLKDGKYHKWINKTGYYEFKIEGGRISEHRYI